MLILTLKEDEKILIGDKITFMVVESGEIKSALGSRRRLAFWFCGKSWREKQRDKGAQEGGSRRNSWCPTRPLALAPPTQQPVPSPTLLSDYRIWNRLSLAG